MQGEERGEEGERKNDEERKKQTNSFEDKIEPQIVQKRFT